VRLLVLVALAFCASPLAAQTRDTTAASFGGAPPPSPGGAFLRAALLPGWGHASIGSYARGAFYFAAEATTGFMLVRTLRRLSDAKDARTLKETRTTEALLASGEQPDDIIELLEEDPAVSDARGLVESRQQQVEDWIALGAFLVFIGGADAFVSAHLADFPAPLTPELELVDGPSGTGARVGVSVPIGPPRAHRPR